MPIVCLQGMGRGREGTIKSKLERGRGEGNRGGGARKNKPECGREEREVGGEKGETVWGRGGGRGRVGVGYLFFNLKCTERTAVSCST